jgi:hypothetical protein
MDSSEACILDLAAFVRSNTANGYYCINKSLEPHLSELFARYSDCVWREGSQLLSHRAILDDIKLMISGQGSGETIRKDF